MKYLTKLVLLVLTLHLGAAAQAQKEEISYNPNLVKDSSKKSIKSAAEGKVGPAAFTINYYSPGVRKRIIWGGVVPFDEVWVTGAHSATAISFDKDILINNKRIEAGKYALFTIPGEEEWTLIINKNYDQHLASDYDEKEDIVRVKVKPQANNHLERLQYFIEPVDKKNGNLSVAWEKVKVTVPFRVMD